MAFKKKLFAVAKKPLLIGVYFTHCLVDYLSDESFLKLKYFFSMGKRLNLNNPKTFNEKLNWLKLYNKNPLYTEIVDKSLVKKHIEKIIGPEYIIPTLGVWNSFDDIDFDKLPNQFVLKTTQGGGNLGVVVCDNFSSFNINKAKNKLEAALKVDSFKYTKEWPYKNVKPRLIAEKYLYEEGGLIDYKFYCFNGKAYKVMMCLDRASGHPKFYSFDRDWNLLRHNKLGKAAPDGFTLPKPKRIDEMFSIADRLSVGIPFVRVDLYHVDNQVYFGEMTFFPDSGFDANILPEIDSLYGSMINLPKN